MADEHESRLKRAVIFVPKGGDKPILTGEVKTLMWYYNSNPRYFKPYEMTILQDGVAQHFMWHLEKFGLEFYDPDVHEELIDTWQKNHANDKPKPQDIKERFRGGATAEIDTFDCVDCDESFVEERDYRGHIMKAHRDKVIA